MGKGGCAPHKAACGKQGRWGEMAPGSLTLAMKLAPAAARDSILASVSAGSFTGLGGEEPARLTLGSAGG